jgi:histidinol-phosphate aminotransferase
MENNVRENIRNLKAYSSARDEFEGVDGIFLDANENPFGTLNRYPDPKQKKLKSKLGELKSIPVEEIFIGNGSDEIIDLALRIFCEPNRDKALTFSPTYGMYEVAAAINNVELIQVPLTETFQIDLDQLFSILQDTRIKLLFICSPNNPTGNILNNIESILERFKGIVLVDEAYIDFSKANSFCQKINQYPRLIVAQTFSKAWGLAAARLGIAYANKELLVYFNKVKPPYNVSELNQDAGLQALENCDQYQSNLAIIHSQKEWLEKELISIPCVVKVYPSDANFILIEVLDAVFTYNYLITQNLITRNRNSLVKNCLRITVGLSTENVNLINALKKL